MFMDKILKLDAFFNSLISEGGIFGKNGFFDKYKYILLLSFICGIFANFTDITNLKYGLDSLDEIYRSFMNVWLNHSRYTNALLFILFPFLKEPVISHIVGLSALCLASMLAVHRLNLPLLAKALFCVIVMTYPTIPYLEYFIFQFVYNYISVLIAVISFLLLQRYFDQYFYTDKEKWYNGFGLIISSSILLTFAISSYQSILAVFLIVAMINILFDYFEDFNFKVAIKKIFFILLVLLVAVILYFLLILFMKGSFTVSGHQAGYFSYSSILNYSISQMGYIFTEIYRALIGIRNYKGFINLPLSILFLIFIIIFSLRLKNKKQILSFLTLIVIFFIASFSINIIFGGGMPFRMMIYLPFFFASMVLFAFMISKSISFKTLLTLITIFILFSHSGYISKLHQAQLVLYENDKLVAQRVLDLIYDKAPNLYNAEKKIVFIGSLKRIYNHQHPIIMNARDAFRESVWAYSDAYPAHLFLYLYGLPTNVQFLDSSSLEQEELDVVKSMPSYPARDCVMVEDDYVIVKLGD